MKFHALQPTFCAQCHTEAVARVHAPGSFETEIVLWVFGIVPGVIYSIWRVGARRLICPKCGSWDLVAVDSPRARKLKEEREAARKPQTGTVVGPGPLTALRQRGQRLLDAAPVAQERSAGLTNSTEL